MRIATIIVFFIFFLAKNSFAQTDTTAFPPLAIAEWRQHLPWQRSVYVTQSTDKVWFATEWAIVEIDKSDRSPRFLTRTDGLSDVGMNLIRYNNATKSLLVGYSNSNLDIYKPEDGSVINLPFIKKNVNIVGDKKLYSVAFEGKFAYLACGFGLLKLNMERAEVVYTVFTDVPVYATAVFQNQIYIGTEEGVYRLPDDDINPADFSRWQMLGAADGFPAGQAAGAMAIWQNQLFVGIKNKLYSFDATTLTEVSASGDRDVFYLTTEGPGLLIGWKRGFDGYIDYREPSGVQNTIHWACDASKPFYGIEDGTLKFWIADDSDQFRYYDRTTDQCERFTFNSPYNHKSSEIAIGSGGAVYVTTPGPNSGLGASFNPDGLYILKDGQWNRFNSASNPELGDATKDMWKVAPHPDGEKFYIGSFVGGVIEATAPGTAAKRFNKNNSILQSAGASGSDITAIAGLAFDKDKNLWISNYSAPSSPVAVLKADGQLRNFSSSPQNRLLQVVVDQNGYKWFVVGFQGGVMVYDSGADIDNPADDRYRVINTANSELPSNTVNCLAVDLDGDIWVGTQQGVVSFECGTNAFDEKNCTGRRRIVNVDGFNGYLLETEDVRTIAIDGANRKWFGTSNGVFVESPDGLTQVANYTNTNSPLFDNNITDIAINGKTGEVWIGTEKGLISLRAQATDGPRVNSPMAYAYPNPVRPDYQGPIAIYGLARDANVKITDISGQLVYEGKALGGQAVWDGRDYKGKRAASGVYLIYATSSTNFESPDAIITKVVILN